MSVWQRSGLHASKKRQCVACGKTVMVRWWLFEYVVMLFAGVVSFLGVLLLTSQVITHVQLGVEWTVFLLCASPLASWLLVQVFMPTLWPLRICDGPVEVDVYDPETLQNIEVNFISALRGLAKDAQAQIKHIGQSFDVPFELVDDYITWAESYQRHCSEKLTPVLEKAISDLVSEVEALPESAFQKTNLLSMQQPEWEPLRKQAEALLHKLEQNNEVDR